MSVYKLFYVLYKIRLLSPRAIFRLFSTINKYGINLMTLLSFSAQTNGNKVAMIDDYESLTYKQLLAQAESISSALQQKYLIKSGRKVGILCKNHAAQVKAMFAVSYSGADLYLLHTELSVKQLDNILVRKQLDFLIYDDELSTLLAQTSYRHAKLLSYHEVLPAISNIGLDRDVEQRRMKMKSGKLIILTGGTTGNAKEAKHNPSLFNYLDPFAAILSQLKINQYHSVYVATPIYHGYGLAFMLLFVALGKKVIIRRDFRAEQACQLIKEHQVEVVSLVPLMLHKMLITNVKAMHSLACIASGSAELSPKLVVETTSQLGPVLYNLYGTSETGLNIIATPQDVMYSEHTIGRIVSGVQAKIVDEAGDEVKTGEIGQLKMKNRLTKHNNGAAWIATGDLAYVDKAGRYYLCGRADSMIVSAGENVYPFEVEQMLLLHPNVDDAVVIGVEDEHFGQRLKAFIVMKDGDTRTNEEELILWLRGRVARFQLPREIVIVDQLPYTALGKRDKKGLK